MSNKKPNAINDLMGAIDISDDEMDAIENDGKLRSVFVVMASCSPEDWRSVEFYTSKDDAEGRVSYLSGVLEETKEEFLRLKKEENEATDNDEDFFVELDQFEACMRKALMDDDYTFWDHNRLTYYVKELPNGEWQSKERRLKHMAALTALSELYGLYDELEPGGETND